MPGGARAPGRGEPAAPNPFAAPLSPAASSSAPGKDPSVTDDETVAGVIADALPLIRALAAGRYAVSIGGSRGKGIADRDSDVDFRLFCDEESPDSAERRAAVAAFAAVMATWRARGLEIDGCWVRRIGDVERELDLWLAGRGTPTPKVWTVWGYHLLPDLAQQLVVEDPFAVAAGWRDRLRTYPAALGRAVIDRHLASLAYWRDDYHYRAKVARGDVVFLAGLSARLVHDLLQVVFALNATYYPGDGDALRFSERCSLKPRGFEERIRAALSPRGGERAHEEQRATLIGLIDDTAALVARSAGQGADAR